MNLNYSDFFIDWIKEKVGPNIIITSKMYNSTINKLSYNKRASVTIKPKNSSDSYQPDKSKLSNFERKFFTSLLLCIR